MHQENHSDLLIIGGGVLGAFHAYHALKRGLSVILLEKHAAPSGASVRNFGQVVPSGLTQQWQTFGRESLEIYREIQNLFDISIRQQGSIYLASDEEEMSLLEELRLINAANDYQSHLWTAEQCRKRYPLLRADYCRGGLFFPEEVSVNPRQMIHRLHQYLSTQSRFESHFQSPVQELETLSNGHVQATTNTGQQFTAQKAILCCGSEFQSLFPKLFAESSLEVVKLQMLRLRPQPEVELPGNILTGLSIRRYESFSECPSWQSIKAQEPDDSFCKKWGIHILFKQEADGAIILGDSHEYATVREKDRLDFDLRAEINRAFIEEGKKIFALPEWEIESSWYGIYCQTDAPSGIFTTDLEQNIHIVTGIGGKGMTSSAGYAKQFLKEVYRD